MQDSSQVCISKGISEDEIFGLSQSIKDSIINAETKTMDLLGYGNKISNFIVECYLDIPVVDQFIFYLMLVNAKNKYAHQLQRVIAEKPELSQIEALQLANNFVLNFEYIRQILLFKNKANYLSNGRIKSLAWNTLNSVGKLMLPMSSLRQMDSEPFSRNDVDSVTHKRMFASTGYFELDNNAFICYQLEETLIANLSELDFDKKGRYTVLDTLTVLGFKDRFDLYMYNLMKINEFRGEVVIPYIDFKALTEFSVEFKYKASDFYRKRLLVSLERLNNNPSIELFISVKYEPCNKRTPDRDNFCNYRFQIQLKSNYRKALNTLNEMCAKVQDEQGNELKISNALFTSAIRLNNGEPEKVIELVKDRLAAYTTKNGPSYLAKNLNLVASYVTRALEDLYKSNHFFERFLNDMKQADNLLYLRNRDKKVEIENKSASTFSSEFINIRDKVDVTTCEILTNAEYISKKTEATVIIDYAFIRNSIFITHPHLRHQRNADEKKYIDLVCESTKLCQIFFGTGNDNKKTLTQNYLTELLFEHFFDDNFHLNSDVLKNLLKKDKDYWVQEKQKTFMRLWKLANEFSLKAISPANYNGKESSDNE